MAKKTKKTDTVKKAVSVQDTRYIREANAARFRVHFNGR